MNRFLIAVMLVAVSLATAGLQTSTLGSQPASQANPKASDLAAKSAQVDALLAPLQGNSPGVAVMVIKDGQVVHHKGYGLARIDRREAIAENTAFDLASTSKQFTAMAIMILAERGKLSYEDPLSKYFPEFPSYAQKIKIRHLLTHTSGLVDVINASWFKAGYEPTSKEVAAFVSHQAQPKSAPGERFEYNNTGYLLLALIVEKASGESFAKFMHKNIFAPLGMNHSLIWDERKPKIEHLAVSYAPAGGSFNPIGFLSDKFVFGAKGVITTTSDLIKWIQNLDSPKLVKPATLQLAFTPTKLNDGSESPYGFGWGIGRDNGLLMIEHPGGYLGYRVNIRRYPTERTTIVLLSNNGQTDVQSLTRSIARIYLGDKMVAPQAKLKIDPAALASFAGKYESEGPPAPNLAIEITLENGDLYITSALRPKAKLLAQSATEFLVGESTATVTFKTNEKGAVKGLAIKTRMGVIDAKRLE